MKVILVHHANALSAEEDPARHLSEKGRKEAARLGGFLKAQGISLVRILHSDKQWTLETGERVAEAMGASGKTATAAYGINTGDSLDPFMAEINASNGDIMMTGHSDYIVRAASKMLTGDESNQAIEVKPGNGTAFCLEGSGDNWVLAWGWRQEQLPG
ncbi:MAG: histidine phosphatase family protein [Proteobacteria bacterium]|nr:histidine phosphatase family protein [Pseudomonadota bacterium]